LDGLAQSLFWLPLSKKPLNYTGETCESLERTEPPLFDVTPYSVVGDLGTDTGGETEEVKLRGTVASLAMQYVVKRRESGQIGDRTATQLRYRLLDFADHAPKNPKRIYRRHVEAWMARPELAPQYLRSRLSSLRGFTKWCVAEGHMKSDPCLLVPMPFVPPQMPKRLTEDEARRLVAATSHDRRLRLVVLLMLQEGLRRIEISRLNVEDIDFAERSMILRGKGGQGGYTDSLPITDETWAALTSYLEEEGHANGPLIRNRVRKHGRTSPQTVSELVREAMYASGVKPRGDHLRTPHSCRHTTAHAVLKKTGDIRKVQKVMRHRSIRTTEATYLNGYVDDLRPAMEGRRYGGAAS
jgi:integrase